MRKTLRTIIVDDERLARTGLRTLLEALPRIAIVGEADSVASAAELIDEEDPDLIFLDIQMPGETGFDLLKKVEIDAKVIFVTAFDEYAIRAFDVAAADYLLKPVHPDRLQAAIARLDNTEQLKHEAFEPLMYDDSILLSINSHLRFVKVSSIVCIQAAGDYSEVTTHEFKRGLVQKTMAEWEQRLPQRNFSRIHRSTIVNIEQVRSIDDWFGNSHQVHLKGMDTPFVMSRRYAAALRRTKG